MNINFLSILLLGAALTVVSGCTKTATIYNVENHSVVTNKSQYTLKDVELAILRGGAAAGWQMSTEKPGSAIGTLRKRVHTAVVDISYDLDSYNIEYRDSNLLKYEAAGSESIDEDGNAYINETAIIHKNYNLWVKDLDSAIQIQLLSL